MSKLNEIRNCYFFRNSKNIHYFIIFISLLTFAGYVVEKTASLQIIQAQSSNTQIQSNNNINTNTQRGSVPAGNNNFILSGPLSSFLSTPSGNWVVNGTWSLKVQNGNLTDFKADMQWDPTNLTKVPHSHNFANFRADPNSQSISLKPDRTIDIKGIMDIGAKNKIEWVNVPAEIRTAGNTITVSILDDSKTGNHFNNYPILGKIAKVSQINTDINNISAPNNGIDSQPIQPHESTKTFRMDGNIDSILYTTSGSKWNTAGSWSLIVDNGKLTLFNSNTTWQNTTSSHTHEFLNFKTKAKSITLKPTNDLSIKGVMDIGTNNQISWTSVPSTISIVAGKIITITVDDKKTDHHFAGQSIHGIVNKLTL